MNKDNNIIEDIKISEEKLREYERKVKGYSKSAIQLSNKGKLALIKLYYGICCICAVRATKRLKYDEGDGIIMQKYCDKCLESYLTKEQEQEPSTYTKEDKVYLTATNGADQTLTTRMQEWRKRNGYGTYTKT